eukprot:TRINITY_DN74859_c0_g1_i1.p1 TRINITY_DN74859_c0_g1~~TRINITY_DN74859_c0_g1_i1.p1  ORF type:complete len:313 (-),score=50.73 TRINITY_DN74859_c0_g1_i1:122-1060(-)
MNNDDVIWNVLRGTCGFRFKLPVESGSKTGRQGREAFCRHYHSVTQKCERGLCPLAQQRYATVVEKEGKILLCIKTAERVHMPAKWWEEIVLPIRYTDACDRIDEELEGFPPVFLRRCKARFLRLKSILKRTRRLAVKSKGVLVRIDKKHERVLKKREIKAHRAAKVEQHIMQDLLSNLKEGVYDELLSDKFTDEQFEALAQQQLDEEEQAAAEEEAEADEEEEVEDSEDELELEGEDRYAKHYNTVYKEADSDSEDSSEDDEPRKKGAKRRHISIGSSSSSSRKPPPPSSKRQRVMIEHEIEQEPAGLADW